MPPEIPTTTSQLIADRASVEETSWRKGTYTTESWIAIQEATANSRYLLREGPMSNIERLSDLRLKTWKSWHIIKVVNPLVLAL
jgi:hypothetical protein